MSLVSETPTATLTTATMTASLKIVLSRELRGATTVDKMRARVRRGNTTRLAVELLALLLFDQSMERASADRTSNDAVWRRWTQFRRRECGHVCHMSLDPHALEALVRRHPPSQASAVPPHWLQVAIQTRMEHLRALWRPTFAETWERCVYPVLAMVWRGYMEPVCSPQVTANVRRLYPLQCAFCFLDSGDFYSSQTEGVPMHRWLREHHEPQCPERPCRLALLSKALVRHVCSFLVDPALFGSLAMAQELVCCREGWLRQGGVDTALPVSL